MTDQERQIDNEKYFIENFPKLTEEQQNLVVGEIIRLLMEGATEK